ncbi:MAG: molecular chaperone [Xanthobacteraceae bacterium]|jgi:fimbrial chaperone protein
MRKLATAILSTALLTSAPTLVAAAALQVSPVSLDIPAPAAATTIKLRNVGAAPINAQIRVFKWAQENGEEKLEPTEEVVASPPLATLAPNTDYTVRLVRVSKKPVGGGETYRLLVDELPDNTVQRNGTITMILRYSIPVFFYPANVTRPKLTWSIVHRGGKSYVSASNNGDRHVRLAGLKLQPANGAPISYGEGLIGYVLGHSTKTWPIADGKKIAAGSAVAITAQTDAGVISASASMQPAR